MKHAHGLVLFFFLAGVHGAIADELLIKAIDAEPVNAAEGVPRPEKGSSMDEVIITFGQPQEKLAPIGNPPITRWVYKKFIVFFEDKWVIQAILKR